MAENISIKQVFRSRWLGIKHVSYQINGKPILNYEMVFRPNQEGKNLDVQSVDIIPIIKYQNKPKQIILIANFRPPVLKYVIQFPSGIMEDNDVKSNAVRQLKQQTGYELESIVQFPTPTIFLDPWKGDQSTKMLLATVDGDKNQFPKQELQYDENIQVLKFRLDKTLLSQILQLSKKRDFIIQGKVWAICMGLNMMDFV